jgi:hypothetical protein
VPQSPVLARAARFTLGHLTASAGGSRLGDEVSIRRRVPMRLRISLAVLTTVALVLAAMLPIGSIAASSGNAASGHSVLLDCNGYGAANNPDHPTWRCADIRKTDPADQGFEDNGHYVGHDEPAIQFFSTTPGSGNSARYAMTLPVDPSAAPNGTVAGPVWGFQTHIAPWFGMVMCDTESYPETRKICVPDSDTNITSTPTADHAGAAYMELQFYPPGYSPSISCDQIHWCAALTITSLQGNFDFSNLNQHCVEPQAFAYVTLSGAPIGPTGPDNATVKTFKPTSDVLLMGAGDQVSVSMFDTTGGFHVEIADQTTGATGTMTAGAANGWRHIIWDPTNHNCKGEPYTFHPMYSTAAPPVDGQPQAWTDGWTTHTYNVAMSDEIGHFETPDRQSDGKEETPCFPGPVIRGCLGTDTDFDGYGYQETWPDGTANHPGPWTFSSPQTLVAGTWTPGAYDSIQFESDMAAISATCNVFTGAGCTNPPTGANFYPWFHLVPSNGTCAWTLSNDIPGQLSNFGGEQAAWGSLELIDYGAGFLAYLNYASGSLSNPCL